METQFTQHPGENFREGMNITPHHDESAVAWCAVFAGAVASAALSLILLLLGTGFGLTLVSPWASEGISSTTFGISIGDYPNLVTGFRNRWLSRGKITNSLDEYT